MTRTTHLAYIGALVLCAGAAALAPDGVTFDVAWHTMDGGGGTSTAGDLELSGTIGQPDAGGPMTGGGFELIGGFWPGGTTTDTCPADVDSSGAVDFNDLLAVLAAWGSCPDCREDVNGDAFVDFNDLLLVLAAWGPCE